LGFKNLIFCRLTNFCPHIQIIVPGDKLVSLTVRLIICLLL
jgi:hypothetical protein